jgi:hypothetical protein
VATVYAPVLRALIQWPVVGVAHATARHVVAVLLRQSSFAKAHVVLGARFVECRDYDFGVGPFAQAQVVLDEGAHIMEDGLAPIIDSPIALVATAEKARQRRLVMMTLGMGLLLPCTYASQLSAPDASVPLEGGLYVLWRAEFHSTSLRPAVQDRASSLHACHTLSMHAVVAVC